MIEAKLSRLLLPPDENTRFINNLGTAKLNLSRGYMPVMVINLVGRKTNKSK